MLRASTTEALKQALFLHNQHQCCNYFPAHKADPCYLWWWKLRFNQCNSPVSVSHILVLQKNKSFWHFPFLSYAYQKVVGGGEMKLVVCWAKPCSIWAAPPNKADIYHNYLFFSRGSFVILTLIKEHNTKPHKLGCSSVSLQSLIPSVLFLLCHRARGFGILHPMECYERARVLLLLTALLVLPYIFAPEKPPNFLWSPGKITKPF